MSMSYHDLRHELSKMTTEQLNQTATIYDPRRDEYIPLTIAFTDESCDVLDENHCVLTSE